MLARVVLFLVSMAGAFAVTQVSLNQLQASHNVGPNSTCSNDGEYYHVHWERIDDVSEDRTVTFYDVYTDENGADDEYEPDVDSAIDDWNTEQSFVTYAWVSSPNYEIVISAAQYGTSYLGKAELDPNQCTFPNSRDSTHAETLGTSYILLNSQEIEATSDPDHARQWTATHELGHTLSLGHDDDNQSSRVMYYEWSTSVPTTVQSGDVDRLDAQSDPYGHLH